jgi:hypothetical protein
LNKNQKKKKGRDLSVEKLEAINYTRCCVLVQKAVSVAKIKDFGLNDNFFHKENPEPFFTRVRIYRPQKLGTDFC